MLGRLAILVPASVGTLAGLAIAATIKERVQRAERGLPAGPSVITPPAAALASLALALIALPSLSARTFDVRAHVVATAFVGALWLAGRADEDVRLRPVFLLAAGAVLGAQLLCGLALLPAIARALVRRPRGLHAVAGGALVLGAAAGLGRLLLGGGDSTLPMLTVDHLAASSASWLIEATRALGPLGGAAAAAGLVASLTGAPELRELGVVGCLLLVGELALGHLAPVGVLALALGLGLAVADVSRRPSIRALRGGAFFLVPLVALVLFEPTARRLASLQLTVPTLGPVPPPGPVHARPAARAPARR